MNKKILITGGSGLIGTRLTELLTQAGHSVAHLGRSVLSNGVKTYLWNIEKKTIDQSALASVDAVIHLAGANVGDKRWTPRRKEEILHSRIQSTRLLFKELSKGNHRIKSFVFASAIGFYGSGNGQVTFTENDPKGSGFLADVVSQNEAEAEKIEKLGIRLVKFRGGAVLSERGGALKEMLWPVKLYIGSPLGTGKQIISWIHIDDLCRMFIKAVEDENMQGVYNAVTPNPISNRDFTYVLANVLKRPIWLPRVPSFLLDVLFGEMAEVVLKGAKVSSEKIQAAGFDFKFPNAEGALQDLLLK